MLNKGQADKAFYYFFSLIKRTLEAGSRAAFDVVGA